MATTNGIDGPARSSQRGLRILIVGAGIGGLTAAIALRQQGHEVIVWTTQNIIYIWTRQLTGAPDI